MVKRTVICAGIKVSGEEYLQELTDSCTVKTIYDAQQDLYFNYGLDNSLISVQRAVNTGYHETIEKIYSEEDVQKNTLNTTAFIVFFISVYFAFISETNLGDFIAIAVAGTIGLMVFIIPFVFMLTRISSFLVNRETIMKKPYTEFEFLDKNNYISSNTSYVPSYEETKRTIEEVSKIITKNSTLAY